MGYGNLLGGTKRLNLLLDAGVVFQGDPSAKLKISGSGCDASGRFCKPILNSKDARDEILSEQQRINRRLRIASFYPIVSIGFGYRF